MGKLVSVASDVDWKAAIIKYLQPDWTEEEQQKLKKIRHELALKAVPEALSFSDGPVPPNTIEDYVTILTEEPDSEKGQTAREYLADLQRRSKNDIKTFAGNIGDLAKLHYLSEIYLKGSGIEYGRLHFDKGGTYRIDAEDGKVDIRGDFPWRIILSQVPSDSTINVGLRHVDFQRSDFDIPDDTYSPKVRIKPGTDAAQIAQAAANDYKKRLLQSIDKARQSIEGKIERSKRDKHGMVYKVEFAEGDITNGSVTLKQYSPRLEPLLDTLLKPMHNYKK